MEFQRCTHPNHKHNTMKPYVKFDCPMQWESMPETNNGKHCAACKKNIQDLTTLTAEQLHQKYVENKGELCGRISSSQLATPMLVTAGLTLLTSAVQGQANTTMVTPEKIKTQPTIQSYQAAVMEVSGTVTSTDSMRIPFVSIAVKSAGELIAQTQTDVNGMYKLYIQRNKLKAGITEIIFASPGLDRQGIALRTDHNVQTVNMTMSPSEIMLDEVLIVEDRTPSVIVGVIAYSTCRIVDAKYYEPDTVVFNEPVTDTNALVLFPNPANDYVQVKTEKEGSYTLEVYTTDGKLVTTSGFEGSVSRIQLHEWPVGNYLVRLEDKNTHAYITDKLVIVR